MRVHVVFIARSSRTHEVTNSSTGEPVRRSITYAEAHRYWDSPWVVAPSHSASMNGAVGCLGDVGQRTICVTIVPAVWHTSLCQKGRLYHDA